MMGWVQRCQMLSVVYQPLILRSLEENLIAICKSGTPLQLRCIGIYDL